MLGFGGMARDAQQGAFERTVGGLNWPFADVLSVFSLGTGEKKASQRVSPLPQAAAAAAGASIYSCPVGSGPVGTSGAASLTRVSLLVSSAASRSTSHARCFRACLFVCFLKKTSSFTFHL